MSTKRKIFELEGCGMSIYPDNIDVLNRLYDAVGGNGSSLEYMFRKLPGFTRLWIPNQRDWFWVAEFLVEKKGRVEIFMPWCQDWHGNLKLNKSIALCAIDVSEREYLDVLQRVIDCFWDQYFAFSKHDYRRKLPDDIFARILEDGRKAVPEWYVDVRASLNPVAGGDTLLSHLAARKWFEDQGFVVI